MPTEREYARDNTIQANIREDRDLTCEVQTLLDRRTLAALDAVVDEENWVYRSSFVRHLITMALRQRGRI